MARFKLEPEQLEEFKALYPGMLNKDLAVKYGCTLRAVNEIGPTLGVKKDRAFIAEVARKNMERPDHPARKFWKQKGNISPTTGLKQADFMTPEQIEHSKTTRFKKGIRPWNTANVGDERVNSDGYHEVKVADPNKWEGKHRIVWRENFGAIPTGHNVQFKDKNPSNIDPFNLYTTSRADQLKNENSILVLYPEEIQKVMRNLGQLNKHIRNHDKTN